MPLSLEQKEYTTMVCRVLLIDGLRASHQKGVLETTEMRTIKLRVSHSQLTSLYHNLYNLSMYLTRAPLAGALVRYIL